ncbi:hypothetical protein [Sphingomonas morindae]|uniref:Flap endonuclease-1-like 5' DNA nuclease n=1 Tax=Sphingomonas morindae TaxID=1541170 RepID=A0ABY4X5S7_9SPHN|nr:hypothetical protein [Sphingomonas morindae]USI72268.1 hypothetical protein LHA26_13330 [Sphingomonas morindae]
MMGFTANQWAILVLVLVLGWLLGLVSRSGGGRWRRQYEIERAARVDAESRLTAAERRAVELERRPAVAPVAAAPVAATAAPAATLAPVPESLTRIEGIDEERALRLHEAGIHGYADLAALSDSDAALLEERTRLAPGTIARLHWREQAAALRDGTPYKPRKLGFL